MLGAMEILLRLRVADTGPGIAPAAPLKEGIGLSAHTRALARTLRRARFSRDRQRIRFHCQNQNSISNGCMKLRTVIVDDEHIARQRLRRLLAREAEIEIIAECGNAAEALAAVEEDSPDLLCSTFKCRAPMDLTLWNALTRRADRRLFS